MKKKTDKKYVTGEGFSVTGKDFMLLGINLKDRKWIYFVIALLLPWVYMELMGLMAIIYIQPIAAIVSGVTVSDPVPYGRQRSCMRSTTRRRPFFSISSIVRN